MKIYFGDLVHTGGEISVWTMPLNIGLVSNYANSQLGGQIVSKFFKRPELLIEKLINEPPDVLALSYYVWNVNLNKLIAKIARSYNKDILIIGGGPIFTNENKNQESASRFFKSQLNVDAFVLNQGEIGFAHLISSFMDAKKDRQFLINRSHLGALVFNENKIFIGADPGTLDNLNDIPSPYLNGQLDEFFKEATSPIIETNRSCPYRCTFCAWGIGSQKLAQYDTERVLNEIEYIAKRQPLSKTWFIADANFGILERDQLFALKLSEMSKEYGNPQHVSAQWNKTRPDRVYAAAKHLFDISQVGASMQSLHEPTLRAIKRKNLTLEQVKAMTDRLNLEGADMKLFSELIVPLPEETFETHLHANRKLMSMGAQVFNYNLHLLPGTEMDSDETRLKYFNSTGYRLHDAAFGTYHGTKVFEGQEVVLSTSTMSRAEVSSLRFIHFLLQYMWQRSYHYEYLIYLENLGYSPVDIVLKLSALIKDNEKLKEVYADFYEMYAHESFQTEEDLYQFWSRDANYKMLVNGDYGKLNALFTYKIEADYLESFQALLLDSALIFLKELNKNNLTKRLPEIKSILEFSKFSRVQMEKTDLTSELYQSFDYDVHLWKKEGYKGDLNEYKKKSTIKFYLKPEQEETLRSLLSQFKSESWSTTLRKMSEYSMPETFFYSSSPVTLSESVS